MALQPFTIPTAAADIEVYRLVQVSAANTANLCSATTDAVGATQNNRYATGEPVEVTPLVGVLKLTASAPITAGAKVYAAASGKLTPTAGTRNPIGVALVAASADGDVIDVACPCTNHVITP